MYPEQIHLPHPCSRGAQDSWPHFQLEMNKEDEPQSQARNSPPWKSEQFLGDKTNRAEDLTFLKAADKRPLAAGEMEEGKSWWAFRVSWLWKPVGQGLDLMWVWAGLPPDPTRVPRETLSRSSREWGDSHSPCAPLSDKNNEARSASCGFY